MKTTGITRPIDSLGRIVVPKELRDCLNINIGDRLEVLLNGSDIVLRKYSNGCQCCGEAENLIEYKGLRICKDCIVMAWQKAEQK